MKSALNITANSVASYDIICEDSLDKRSETLDRLMGCLNSCETDCRSVWLIDDMCDKA
jgi:hypothetical protein